MALSLYRTYRPRVFSDVVGQEHIERTLERAVREGSVAHAYLFCGPRGTGKTTTARLLAKALNCDAAAEERPDGTCPQCQAIARGTHPDVYELDAASHTGVDAVREEIIERVNFAPTLGKRRVYIVDEVHMFSKSAFNALLKTLEEPPEHVVFILCTTEARKVPDTIQSRCQRFDFQRLSVGQIVGYLERICDGEGFSAEKDALEQVAVKSDGGMRDATTALEQVAVFSGGTITCEAVAALFNQLDDGGLFELSGYVAAHDAASCLTWLERLVSGGSDLAQFARDFAAHMRDLYVVAVTGGQGGAVHCSARQLERYREHAARFTGPEQLARALGVCGELLSELRSTNDARLSIEIALVRLCRPDCELTLEALAERIEALEAASRGTSAGAPAPAPKPSWEAVAPRDVAPSAEQERERQVAHAQRRAASSPDGMPLAEAVKREAEREEAASYARECAAEAHEHPQEAAGAAGAAAPEQHQPDTGIAPSEQQPDAGRGAGSAEQQPVAAAGAAANMSPARLLAAVLTAIKREDEATAALLAGVQLDTSGTGYTLLFPPDAEFAMRLASSGSAATIIGAAFAEVTGQHATFRCKLAPAQGPAPARLAASAQPATRTQQRGDGDAHEPANASAHAAAPAPSEDAPVYDEGYDYGSYDEEADAAFAASTGADGMSADVASALAVFGEGVSVQELDT